MSGYTKSIYSGEYLEIYHYEKAPKLTGRKHRKRETPSDGRRPDPKPRRYDNILRLRKKFIRLVRSNTSPANPPTLLTLTMRTNVGIETGLPLFNRFTQRAARTFGSSFKYIGVPEFQKRGAIHFHLLVWGINDYADQERDTRYLQNLWGYGYVDCVRTDGSPKLAGYLAKYMQKALHDERLIGKRAYYVSRNVSRPLQFSHALVATYSKQIIGKDMKLVTEREFDTEWLGKCTYRLLRADDQEVLDI